MSSAATSQLINNLQPIRDSVRDIILWRKTKQSLAVLLTATATWVLLQVYQFNFISVFSWLAIFIATSLFLCGNLFRLLGKEPPSIPGLEVLERSAIEIANAIRELVEDGIRWMFRVAAEGEVFTFSGVVGGLWLLYYLGRPFDFVTLLYIGTVMGMSVPALYVTYEDNLRSLGEMMKIRIRRYGEMIDEKVVKNLKKKKMSREENEKKLREDKVKRVE